MPAFLYFLNNAVEAPRNEDLGKLGLAHAFSRVPSFAGVSGFACGEIRGLNGVILFDEERIESGRAAFHPGQQTWLEIPPVSPDSARLFVGMYNDARPSPGDLQRVNMLPGESLELGDQKKWVIPIARSWGDEGWSDELPRTVSVLPDGRWQSGQVVPRHRELWEIASLYLTFIMGAATPEEDERIQKFGIYSAATLALSANYLVGPAEVSLLGLLDRNAAVAILNSLIQRQRMEEFLQKKMTQVGAAVPASSNSSAGLAGSTATTDPPT